MRINKKVWLPAAILLIALLLAALMVAAKSKAERKPDHAKKTTMVRIMEVEPQTRRMSIKAYATTEAAKELSLSAQVAGRVKSVSPDFTDGAWVKEGELLFELDPADYEIRVKQALAGVARAEYDLDNALAQQKVARQGLKSYQRAQGDKKMQVSSLALYGPQIKNAEAALESARASLKQAELNLERTKVRAPFDGFFRQVKLAEGQVVNPGVGVATFFAARPVRLRVAIPLSELPWIKAEGETGEGAKVLLRKKIGQKLHQWEGSVTRRLLEIDSLGHMAQVMVEVQKTLSDQGFPLPIGMQVELKIQGEEIDEAVTIPLYALRSNDKAWLVDPKSQLEIRKLEILRKDEGLAFVSSGLNRGDRLIISPLDNPLPGTPLEIYQNKEPNRSEIGSASDVKDLAPEGKQGERRP